MICGACIDSLLLDLTNGLSEMVGTAVSEVWQKDAVRELVQHI